MELTIKDIILRYHPIKNVLLYTLRPDDISNLYTALGISLRDEEKKKYIRPTALDYGVYISYLMVGSLHKPYLSISKSEDELYANISYIIYCIDAESKKMKNACTHCISIYYNSYEKEFNYSFSFVSLVGLITEFRDSHIVKNKKTNIRTVNARDYINRDLSVAKTNLNKIYQDILNQ